MKAGFKINAINPGSNSLNPLLNQIGNYANVVGLALGLEFTSVPTITLTNTVLTAD